jgi:archaellum biogenesis protein FlaJ (TadC family)
MISIGILYVYLKKIKIMKQNWYKSREEIKREKQQKRRTLATIVIVYVIVCVAILLMNYFDK